MVIRPPCGNVKWAFRCMNLEFSEEEETGNRDWLLHYTEGTSGM